MPIIDNLLNELTNQDIVLSDKAVQSLTIAADNAQKLNCTCGTDDLLLGTIRCDGLVAKTICDLLTEKTETAVHQEIAEAQKRRSTLDGMDEFVRPTWICSRGFIQGYHRTDSEFTTPSITQMREVYGNMVMFAKEKPVATLESFDIFRAATNVSTFTTWDTWDNRKAADIPVRSRGAKILRAIGINLNTLKDTIDSLLNIDDTGEQQCFLLTLDAKGRFRLQPFDLLDYHRFKAQHSEENVGLSVIRSNLVSINYNSFFLQEEIEELEWLINKSDTSESELQKFFEDHPKFLLGTEYKKLHGQMILTRHDQPDLIPDFFVERVDNSFCDIIDLKKPQAKLLVGKENRRTFSAALISALGQLREYRNFFDDPANRNSFHGKYGLQAFRPQISVIIGRSDHYYDRMERIRVEDELKNLRIVTYDDLLAFAKNRQFLLSGNRQ